MRSAIYIWTCERESEFIDSAKFSSIVYCVSKDKYK